MVNSDHIFHLCLHFWAGMIVSEFDQLICKLFFYFTTLLLHKKEVYKDAKIVTCCSCRSAVNSGQNYRFPILQQIHSERTLCSCLFVARKVKVKTFTLFSKMGSDSDCEAPKEETEEEV